MSISGCTSSAPVIGVVQFDSGDFQHRYPEFAGVSADALQQNFNIATLLLGNGCGARVTDAVARQSLLWLLVAHITALQAGQGSSSDSISGLIGRVTGATQGSVSITTDYASNVGASMAYFIQTQYGALYWQATARYRTMRYIAPARRCYGAAGYYGPSGNDGGGWPY